MGAAPLARDAVEARALAEHEGLCRALLAAGVSVVPSPGRGAETPDAVFPNNWISTHFPPEPPSAGGGTGEEPPRVWTYPMRAASRRRERTPWTLALVEGLAGAGGGAGGAASCAADRRPDWPSTDAGPCPLEGTGSLVLDRARAPRPRAVACLSERTAPAAADAWGRAAGVDVVAFWARDARGGPVYHTNVVAWIGLCVKGVPGRT